MTLTRRAREWVIVAVLIALPVLFLRANLKSPSDINWLDRAVLRISSPIEAALTWIGRGPVTSGRATFIWYTSSVTTKRCATKTPGCAPSSWPRTSRPSAAASSSGS